MNLPRWKVSIALESFHRFPYFMPSRPMGSSLGFQCAFRWVLTMLFAGFAIALRWVFTKVPFTGFYRFSQVFTGSTGFHRFSQVFTDFHRFSQIFTGFHRFSQVFTGIHRFSQVFTDFHRFSQVFTGLLPFFRWVSLMGFAGFLQWILLGSPPGFWRHVQACGFAGKYHVNPGFVCG